MATKALMESNLGANQMFCVTRNLCALPRRFLTVGEFVIPLKISQQPDYERGRMVIVYTI